MSLFIVRPFFFEEIGLTGRVTCTINGVRYESPLRNHVISALQQRVCVGNTIFIQDGTPPHIRPGNEEKLEKNGVVLKFGTVVEISTLNNILKVPDSGGYAGDTWRFKVGRF
ncbi:hypothetical protein AVEN_123113-1 [Araneus ventricosus]|uniref:Uncharacterized protein n=1 Tax=Araneus ventricosus TaxID=182803 RepID=A0A4Y2NA53_ARAVE|nr:hypothetical protein AVEN_123113-1 [Araneus ventricosus]